MPRPILRGAAVLLAVASPLFAPASASAGDPEGNLAERYGFLDLVISKVGDGAGPMVSGDVDGDGHADLAVVINPRAKIEFLLPGGRDEPPPKPDRVNELPEESFFRRESLPVEESLFSIRLTDLDGDGGAEVVTLGESKRVTVYRREQRDRYVEVFRADVEEPAHGAGALRVGDVDGDGRLDILVMGRNEVVVVAQGADGAFDRRFRLPTLRRATAGFLFEDLDGDGRSDLLFVAPDSDWSLRHRLNLGGGRFGPEVASRFAPIRALATAQLDADSAAEILVLRRRSGRLARLDFERRARAAGAAEGIALSAPRTVPYEAIEKADERRFLLADLDGDGGRELLVTEPSAARVVVYGGLAGGRDAVRRVFPSLLGCSDPRLVDLDGDGRAEIVVAAAAERAIGVASVAGDGAVGFPEARPVPEGGDVLALDGVAGGRVFAVLGVGKGRSRRHRVVRMTTGDAPEEGFDLGRLKSDPNALWLVDVDGSGDPDLLVFVPRSVPRILLRDPAAEGGFRDVEADRKPGLGLLEGQPREALDAVDLDGDGLPEVLVPGPNFVRAFRLDAEGDPIVVSQTNLERPGARLTHVRAGDFDGRPGLELVVVDASRSQLVVLDPDGRERAAVDLGDIQVRGLFVADLDGDGRDDVVVTADDAHAVLLSRSGDEGFSQSDDLELPLEEASWDDVDVGDLDGDGRPDLVVLDTTGHRIAVVASEKDGLEYALHWRVFEERIFERGGRGGREPRQILVADVTADGRDDVCVLVHDRVLVYPQEPAR